MSWKPMQRRTLALVAVILPLLALLAPMAWTTIANTQIAG